MLYLRERVKIKIFQIFLLYFSHYIIQPKRIICFKIKQCYDKNKKLTCEVLLNYRISRHLPTE